MNPIRPTNSYMYGNTLGAESTLQERQPLTSKGGQSLLLDGFEGFGPARFYMIIFDCAIS